MQTKTFSSARMAGQWQDIIFDTPFTLQRITSAANGNDLASLIVGFSGGGYYAVINPPNGNVIASVVSGGQGVYVAELSIHRAINSIPIWNGVVAGSYIYGVDILFEEEE